MSDASPFAPPRSTVADVIAQTEEYQEVRYWAAQGRIGRLRYLAALVSSYLLFVVVFGLSTLALSISKSVWLTVLIGLAGFIAFMVFVVLVSIQRAHDMEWSGWTVLLIFFIPFAQFAWLFVPGSRGANEYGAPPPPNNWGVRILALTFPVLFIVILGIVSAVALPAYNGYVERARTSQVPPPSQ